MPWTKVTTYSESRKMETLVGVLFIIGSLLVAILGTFHMGTYYFLVLLDALLKKVKLFLF